MINFIKKILGIDTLEYEIRLLKEKITGERSIKDELTSKEKAVKTN